LMTLDEFLALPDDGQERELIAGVLKEHPMTQRNRYHAKAEASIAYALNAWRLQQPEMRGDVLSGEAGFTLRRDPDSGVGIDVAYISPETAAAQADDQTTMINGVPILAVEILSPSDKQEDITNKIDEYLTVGVKLVWIVDPHFRTVTVHRGDGKPEFFTSDDELTAEPHLPGFRTLVRTFFE
jgi:Uma2 family endonuclease